jgi:hypothetical protein
MVNIVCADCGKDLKCPECGQQVRVVRGEMSSAEMRLVIACGCREELATWSLEPGAEHERCTNLS